MAFVKGTSGNPSGRSRANPSIKDIARKHTKAAVLALAAISADSAVPPADRINAANSLINLERNDERPQ